MQILNQIEVLDGRIIVLFILLFHHIACCVALYFYKFKAKVEEDDGPTIEVDLSERKRIMFSSLGLFYFVALFFIVLYGLIANKGVKINDKNNKNEGTSR